MLPRARLSHVSSLQAPLRNSPSHWARIARCLCATAYLSASLSACQLGRQLTKKQHGCMVFAMQCILRCALMAIGGVRSWCSLPYIAHGKRQWLDASPSTRWLVTMWLFVYSFVRSIPPQQQMFRCSAATGCSTHVEFTRHRLRLRCTCMACSGISCMHRAWAVYVRSPALHPLKCRSVEMC